MSSPIKAQLQIHCCVLLWGFTAILGKLIALPAMTLVWWRMALVVATLILLPRIWRGLRALSWQLIAIYAGIGVLVTLHWLTFFAAIKLANARSEEHTSELQSLMRISYAVFCLKKKNN